MPLTLGSDVQVLGQGGFASSATQMHPLGARAVTNDCRVFRYCQAGAADLVAGNLIQSAAPIANHLASTAPVVAIGAKSFSFTPGATAGAANLYAEGYLGVSVTPGLGYTYQVAGHAAITASTAFTLYLVDPIQIAFTASSRLGLVHNTYKNVIQTPTTITASVAGVAPYIITTVEYGWLQTWGPCSVLVNGTPAVTAPVINGGTTAGTVDVWTAAAQPTAQMVGHMMQVGVSTESNFVFLQIAP